MTTLSDAVRVLYDCYVLDNDGGSVPTKDKANEIAEILNTVSAFLALPDKWEVRYSVAAGKLAYMVVRQ